MNYYEYLNAKLPLVQKMKDSAYQLDTEKLNAKESTSIFDGKKDVVKYNDNPIFAFAKKEELNEIDIEKLLDKNIDKAEEKKLSPLEVVLKEFLSLDKVKEAVDVDKNGEMSVEEVKDYFNKLLELDGNGEELSLEDFEKAIEALNLNLEEIFEKFAKTVEDNTTPETTTTVTEEPSATVSEPEISYVADTPAVQDYSPASYAEPVSYAAPAASAAPASYASGVENYAPVESQAADISNTESIEQLEAQKVEKEKAVKDSQAEISAVHSGQNENVKAAKDEEAKAKEEYDKALKSDEKAKPFLKDIEKNEKALAKNEENISKNAQKITETEAKISEAENALSSAESELSNLEQQLSALPALKGDESDAEVKKKKSELEKQISAKKKEVDKQKKEIEKLKKELEKLNDEKTKLEEEKTKLEETKAELDKKVEEVCEKETKEKLEAYNKAREKTEEVKKTELDKATKALKEAQDAVKEITAKIAELKKNQAASADRAEKAVQVAEAELAKGVHEDHGNNDSVDIRRYKRGKKNSDQWCAYFTSYCFSDGQGSTNDDTFGYTASSQAIKNRAKKAGHYAAKNSGYTPKRGDVMIWTNPNDTAHGHVGVISEVTNKGVYVIEGNSKDAVRKNYYSYDTIKKTSRINGYVKMNEWLA